MDNIYISKNPEDRSNGRKINQLRPIKITKKYLGLEHSVLMEFGETKVLCSATCLSKTPKWIAPNTHGWVTAEYSLLPQATNERTRRESVAGKISGRTHEISRLIGRSLRSIVNLEKMPDICIAIDCDVLKADGGTRTTSINGAYIALMLLLNDLEKEGLINSVDEVIKDSVSAVSVGIVEKKILLDLEYIEDSRATADINIIMTGGGDFIEIQGGGEKNAIKRDEISKLLELGENACREITKLQKEALE